GGRKHVTDFEATAEAMPYEIEQLAALITDNPAQQRRLARFQGTVEADFATMRDGMRRRAAGGFTRPADVLTELEGTKLKVGEIERLAREMKLEEESLQRVRAAASERTAGRTVLFIVF